MGYMYEPLNKSRPCCAQRGLTNFWQLHPRSRRINAYNYYKPSVFADQLGLNVLAKAKDSLVIPSSYLSQPIQWSQNILRFKVFWQYFPQ